MFHHSSKQTFHTNKKYNFDIIIVLLEHALVMHQEVIKIKLYITADPHASHIFFFA